MELTCYNQGIAKFYYHERIGTLLIVEFGLYKLIGMPQYPSKSIE